MPAEQQSSSPGPGTRLGAVRLAVRDIDRASGFYARAIGLEPMPSDGAVVCLGVDGRVIVELVAAAHGNRPTAGGAVHWADLGPPS